MPTVSIASNNVDNFIAKVMVSSYNDRMFILGIITGILLSIVSTLGTYILSQNKNLYTRFKQVENLVKRKGEVFEPENEDLSDWVNGLKKE